MTEERDSQHTEDPSASAEAQTGGLGAQRGAQGPSWGMPDGRVTCDGCGHVKRHHATMVFAISSACAWRGCGCPFFLAFA